MGNIPVTPEAGYLEEHIADLSSLELIGKVRQCSERECIRSKLDSILERTWQGATLKQKESNQSSLLERIME